MDDARETLLRFVESPSICEDSADPGYALLVLGSARFRLAPLLLDPPPVACRTTATAAEEADPSSSPGFEIAEAIHFGMEVFPPSPSPQPSPRPPESALSFDFKTS